MTKKKFLPVLFFTLLLTLLLGCFSNCYAFDQVDLKNFCYNYMINKMSYTTEYTLNWIDHSTAFSSLDSFATPYYDNNNYKILLIGQGGNIYFLKKSSNSNEKIALRNTSSIDITAWGYSGFHVWTADATNTDNNYTSVYFNNLKNGYFYTDDNMYYNNNVYFSSPKYYPDQHIFDEYYTRDRWIFTPNGTNGSVNGFNNENFSIISASWNTYLGSIVNAQHVKNIYISFASYNQPTGTWIPAGHSILLYDYDRDGNIALHFSGSSSSDGTATTTGLYYKTINRQNCILSLQINSTAIESWHTIVHYFYITNDYTFISGGVIYPSLTFSGDYLNDYNTQNTNNINQDNTDRIIDAITNFDSGDVSGLVDFGDRPNLSDPTSNFISYLVNRLSYAFTSDSSNSSVYIPFYGDSGYRVYASDFDILPTQIKTLIGYIFMIWFFKHYFVKIRNFILAVRTANIGSFAEKVQGGLNVTDVL